MTSTTSSSSFSQRLSDHDLLVEVARAAASERQAAAHLIALLMELDTRRLYLGEGFSSLFTYCTQALHLSEHAAYNRIEAARAARRFPMILQLIGDGAVTLTAVRLLAPNLTPENHHHVLERARHKSKRDIERLIAELHPHADVPSAVRKFPSAVVHSPDITKEDRTTAPTLTPQTDGEVETPMVFTTGCVPRPPRPAEVKPLAPERYKIQVTVSRATCDKLRRAQDLLRHSVPNGDPAEIFDRALTLLVTELERTKIGQVDCPRAIRTASPKSRHVPAGVKRAVWQRDGAGARSLARKAGVPRPASSNTITWCRLRKAARLRRRISSFAAVRTTNMRLRDGSVLCIARSCAKCQKRVEGDARSRTSRRVRLLAGLPEHGAGTLSGSGLQPVPAALALRAN
jgi:hypothetical protein